VDNLKGDDPLCCQASDASIANFAIESAKLVMFAHPAKVGNVVYHDSFGAALSLLAIAVLGPCRRHAPAVFGADTARCEGAPFDFGWARRVERKLKRIPKH
jgi:hypothetical protein